MRTNRTSTGRITLLAAAAVLCGGCATTHRVQVDAVRNATLAGAEERLAYRLVNANPAHFDDELVVQRAAALVQTALSSKGMFAAPEGVAADMVIEFDFDIEGPRRRIEEREVPVYREIPDEQGQPGSGRREFVGTRTVQVVVIEYETYLRISARESAASTSDRPPRELWSVYATHVSRDHDLDRNVTLLVAAAMDEIATDQTAPREIRVSANDDRVVFVQNGL